MTLSEEFFTGLVCTGDKFTQALVDLILLDGRPFKLRKLDNGGFEVSFE